VGILCDAEAVVTLEREPSAATIVRRATRRVGRVAGFATVTAAMLPAFLAHQAVRSSPDLEGVRDRWVSAWSSALLGVFGVRVLARGPLPLHGRGHLVVANHRSAADILVLLRTFGGQMVSRSDLAHWPLVGPAARAVGTVFVDRSDAVSGAAAVRAIRTRLAQGSTVIVFPEGTTFPGDDVRPFHAGAFVAALHSGADVVAVGLAYEAASGAAFVNESFPAHLARMAAAEPSQVAMCIGSPIGISDKTRAARLRDAAREEVQRLVNEARTMVEEAG
jgi:1-acyl-sn-glycerol-3-phosphate acyltransferase